MARDTGSTVLKDPDSTEPYGLDWTEWLEEIDGVETIASSSWTVSEGDTADDPVPATVLTTANPSIVTGSKKTQVKLVGGTAGQRYLITNRITTSSGYIDDRSFYVQVRNR